MSNEMIKAQYKMLLRHVYGDRGRLIRELEETIKLYQESPNSHTDKCVARIRYYQSIIQFAKNQE